MKPSDMSEDQELIVDDMLHAKAKAILHTQFYLNERRGRANCSDDERNQINLKLAELNKQAGLIQLQITALDADTLDVAPPTAKAVAKIRDLATQVDGLNQAQAIAASTWSFIGTVIDATAPLVSA